MRDLTESWLDLLDKVLGGGKPVSPRGKKTLELPQRTLVVDMRRPVVTLPRRKLNYRFMAAEAFWILSGSDQVADLAPYNKRIADFSDDGVRFFGAYGPKIQEQLGYVVGKLKEDVMTRQAGLTIWRESPPATKDVPCTVAVFFNIREGRLNCHVFMRSSDIWLGVPYDAFNFSMLAHYVCGWYNQAPETVPVSTDEQTAPNPITPGALYLTAASSHLYEENWNEAQLCIDEFPNYADGADMQLITPPELHQDPEVLMYRLMSLRESKPGDEIRWWERRTREAQ